MMKPQLLKNKAISKQYDFDLFGSDEDEWSIWIRAGISHVPK